MVEHNEDKLRRALEQVRQELWVDYCLAMGRTDTNPAPFNSRPHIRIIDEALAANQEQPPFIDIVFDGPPSHEAGRFVEVENDKHQSIKVGDWVKREDGYWALRIPHTSSQRGDSR